MLNNNTILITDGTGSFGKMFTKMILERYSDVKLYEEMITESDSYNTIEFDKHFAILPSNANE